MQNPTIRTSFTEFVTFPAKPDGKTLRALRDAGFHWNGTDWVRHYDFAGPVTDLPALLTPINDNRKASA